MRDLTRRGLFGQALKLGGAAGALGAAWAVGIRAQASPGGALRPPGALEERRFLAQCVRCGACVNACPYDTLFLGDPGDSGWGLPTFRPRQIPCEMCAEVHCALACPSGALDEAVKIEEAEMGLAVINPDTCLSYQGLRCEVCYRACPVIDEAISMRYRHQARTGVHAVFEVLIDGEHCTGCGRCEHVCVMEESAIRVLPRGLVEGRVGAHFRESWRPDERRETQDLPEAAPEAAPGLDYLNSEGFP